MFKINKTILVSIICLNLFSISPKSLANEANTIEPITVTGNYFPKKLKETGSAVTIINNQEIEQSGMNYVAQILSATAGYQDYKSGG
ncbi:MAG: hypothetical protein VB916_04740, partial [Alphaproteobacteria bacterium]